MKFTPIPSQPSSCLVRVRRAWRTAGIAACVAAALAGCTSTENLFGSSGGSAGGASPSMTERFSRLFSGGNTQTSIANPANPGAPPQVVDCPAVEIRQGTSTYSISTADPGALGLRFQAVIGQTARECAALGATMTIKLGVQGRVILGPAGGPGQIEVPMRFALVQEGPEPKTIWTKFYKIPVTIGAGQNNVPFVYIEEDLTFPTPKPAELEAYVIYVGFDPLGMKQAPARPQRRR